MEVFFFYLDIATYTGCNKRKVNEKVQIDRTCNKKKFFCYFYHRYSHQLKYCHTFALHPVWTHL